MGAIEETNTDFEARVLANRVVPRNDEKGDLNPPTIPANLESLKNAEQGPPDLASLLERSRARLNFEARGNPREFAEKIARHFPTARAREEAFVVLKCLSQFATVTGVQCFYDRLRELRQMGHNFYLSPQPSVANTIYYLGNEKRVLGTPFGRTNRGFVEETDKITKNTVIIYDMTIRQMLRDDETFRARIEEVKPKFIVPLGMEGHINIFTPRGTTADATRLATIAGQIVQEYYESKDPYVTLPDFTRKKMMEPLRIERTAKLVGEVEVFQLDDDPLHDLSHSEGFIQRMTEANIGLESQVILDDAMKRALNEGIDQKIGVATRYIHECAQVVALPEIGRVATSLIEKIDNIFRKKDKHVSSAQAENHWDKVIFLVSKPFHSPGFIAWGVSRLVQGVKVSQCCTPQQLFNKGDLPPDTIIIVLDDFSFSGDQLKGVYDTLRAPRGKNSIGDVVGHDFKGEILIAPCYATKYAKTWVFNPIKEKDKDFCFVPGKALFDSNATFLASLTPVEKLILSQLGNKGYQNLGLCIQSTYHCPNNSSQFWGKHFAKYFTFNGGGVCKPIGPKGKKVKMRQLALARQEDQKEEVGTNI